ncbi:MAG TPA: NAD(P)-dependent oxidoreductase [Actinotalea sp.]|nr:NAD(P)-dependent oxidoreductase [Actinotalea sp.]
MRPRIVCPSGDGALAPLFAGPDLRARLARLGEVVIAQDVPDEATLVERVARADVVLLTTHLPDDALRAAAGRLRLVAFSGTGAASYVSLPLARELGVTVTNVVRYGDRAVAELTLGLLLAAARDLPAGDRAVRAGQWHGWPGRELAGARAAVVGFGGIGRTVAGMLDALGMEVRVWDRSIDPEALGAVHGRECSLPEAFAADVVTLHLPLTAGTRGLVTAELLDRMPEGSILVNTARGELVEPGALARRLARGDVRAALDVFDPEPLHPGDPLLTVPGTVLSPHLGFRTPQALERMAAGAVASVEAFLAGAPVNVVS